MNYKKPELFGSIVLANKTATVNKLCVQEANRLPGPRAQHMMRAWDRKLNELLDIIDSYNLEGSPHEAPDA